ncbi:MAG TPA: pyridoxamine 5'-phosphate oxidase family protein, partial [Planctomycetota bacterium]|nr:pyridoxamine 5'-phosphate oxidase family protein [Planctomycetota bacterium]
MARRLSPELAQFVQSGLSIQVGTRSASLLPEAVRAVGARVEEGGAEVTVFVPAATGARTVANARENGRIAVCFARIEDHKTIQLKGTVVAAEPARDADRELVDRYRGGIAKSLAFFGLPQRLTYRIAHWPAHALRFRVESVYVQTPGPGAGEPLPGTAAR